MLNVQSGEAKLAPKFLQENLFYRLSAQPIDITSLLNLHLRSSFAWRFDPNTSKFALQGQFHSSGRMRKYRLQQKSCFHSSAINLGRPTHILELFIQER